MAKYRILEDRFGQFHIQKRVKETSYGFLGFSKTTKRWKNVDTEGVVIHYVFKQFPAIYATLGEARSRLNKIKSENIIHHE